MCQGLYSRDTDNYEMEEEDVRINSELSDVSHQIQDIGMKLELSYPSLYVDLPRQLNMPLRSQVSPASFTPSSSSLFGPGNRSPMATNAVLLVVVLVLEVVVMRFSMC